MIDAVERSVFNTTLSASSAGITTMTLNYFINRGGPYALDLHPVLNGILAGLVSITAACAFVQTYSAVIIGAVGGFVYVYSARFLLYLRIDDLLDAFPIHGACGLWGTLAVGIFSVRELQGIAGFKTDIGGLVYGGPAPGKLLGINLLGSVIIISWVVVTIFPLFAALKLAKLLRVDPETERFGIDVKEHGGEAVIIAQTMPISFSPSSSRDEI